MIGTAFGVGSPITPFTQPLIQGAPYLTQSFSANPFGLQPYAAALGNASIGTAVAQPNAPQLLQIISSQLQQLQQLEYTQQQQLQQLLQLIPAQLWQLPPIAGTKNHSPWRTNAAVRRRSRWSIGTPCSRMASHTVPASTSTSATGRGST